MATSLTYLQDESRVDSFLRLSAVVKWWNSREYRADKLESSCKRSSALSVWSPPDRNSYVPRRASFLSQFSSFLRRNNVSSDVSIPGYSLNSRNMRIINKTRSDSTKGRPIQKTSKKNTILLYFFFFLLLFFLFRKHEYSFIVVTTIVARHICRLVTYCLTQFQKITLNFTKWKRYVVLLS